jgi:glc operon protein GlcG
MLTKLTLANAQRAVNHALELSETVYQNRPLSVAVCDKQGFLLAFARMDAAKLLTIELTQRKAYTSSRLGCQTDAFLLRLQKEQLDISYFGDDRFTALPGGIPLLDENKQCIGAVAVGGLSAKEDHEAAVSVAQFLHELA